MKTIVSPEFSEKPARQNVEISEAIGDERDRGGVSVGNDSKSK